MTYNNSEIADSKNIALENLYKWFGLDDPEFAAEVDRQYKEYTAYMSDLRAMSRDECVARCNGMSDYYEVVKLARDWNTAHGLDPFEPGSDAIHWVPSFEN